MSVSYFALSNHQNEVQRFGIKQADRSRHVYVLGKTGTGKSTLLENLIKQDIWHGRGVGVLDPHGSLATAILDIVPAERRREVVYFNPSDVSQSVGLNLLACPDPDKRSLVVSNLISVFYKLWHESWGARMEHYLRNILLSVLEQREATLLTVFQVLNDEDVRERVVEGVSDPLVQMFWQGEFLTHREHYIKEAISPIQNKVGKFLASLPVRYALSQRHKTLDIRQVMDKGQILIANLAKGTLGEDEADLLGSLIASTVMTSALQRVDTAEEERSAFNLVIDEFQNFAPESFPTILSEARKYGLNLTVANQYIGQLEHELKEAIFGNVGTLVSFTVGARDAEFLAREFKPAFAEEDLVNLDKYQVAMRLCIDGMGSQPFSASTLPPLQAGIEGQREAVIKDSSRFYSRKRKKVEADIRWQLENGGQ